MKNDVLAVGVVVQIILFLMDNLIEPFIVDRKDACFEEFLSLNFDVCFELSVFLLVLVLFHEQFLLLDVH